MQSLMGIVRTAIMLVGYLGMLATLAWWMMPVILLVVMPTIILEARFGFLRWNIAYEQSELQRRIGSAPGS